MTLIPQNSLGARTAERLKTMIADGLWTGWLPGERSLSRTLQVGHATLRAALAQLRHEGVVESHHGVGNRIVALPESAGTSLPLPASVGLLIPETVRHLRPFSLWLDDFRDHLIQAGWRLKLYADARHYRAGPDKSLQRLVAQNHHDCWVLVLSSPAMQHWFETSGPPCILAGSCHGGINLPSVDVDHRAVSRHAAGVLLRAGHRHLALFNPSS
ncbi:MAG TPA: GntR family transcriptional regulator, partial [Rariglobus sp.]